MELLIGLAFIGLLLAVCFLWFRLHELEGRQDYMQTYVDGLFEHNKRMHELMIKEINELDAFTGLVDEKGDE